MKRKPEFVDAQQMHRDHPATFEVPTCEELDAIAPGDLVKVATEGERFWTIVTAVDGNNIAATVDNELIATDTHGLRLGDPIQYTKDNVYSIYEK